MPKIIRRVNLRPRGERPCVHSRPNGFLHDWHRPQEGKGSRDEQMCQPGTAGQVGRYTCCLIKSLLTQCTGVSICISQHWERRLDSKMEIGQGGTLLSCQHLGGRLRQDCGFEPSTLTLPGYGIKTLYLKKNRKKRKEREKEKECIFRGLSLAPPLHHSQISKAWRFSGYKRGSRISAQTPMTQKS